MHIGKSILKTATAHDTEKEHPSEAKIQAQVAAKWLQIAFRVVEVRSSEEPVSSVQDDGVISGSRTLNAVTVGTLLKTVFVECLYLRPARHITKPLCVSSLGFVNPIG